MAQDRLRIVFVGHVDHGKSTLIGRLLCDTGSVPPDRLEALRGAPRPEGREVELAHLVDHLREEREQEFTLDTAQVFFRTADREYVVIDAPGHREFLRNMLTGASQADAAVLVVDASRGVEEQTRRHAFLLSLLGVAPCLVAVNKMDLAGFAEPRFREVVAAAARCLRSVRLPGAVAVPVSARLGDNVVAPSPRMPWHGGSTLLGVLEALRIPREVAHPLRFCVQDVYRFDGRRLVAGRVESGALDAGDWVAVLPEGTRTEVLSIERFQSGRTTAEAGECVGLTLPEQVAIRRGQVLCDPQAIPPVVSRLRVRVFWMGDEPLRRDERVCLRVVTQETACRVEAVERRVDTASLEVLEEHAETLGTTEVGELALALDTPLVVEPFASCPPLGRVVLERSGSVAGAGILIGPEPGGLPGGKAPYAPTDP